MSEQERAFGLQAGVVLVDHVVSAESVADDNAKALSLFAEATPITSLTMCLRSLASRPVASSSSPPTMPRYSPDAQARVTAAARAVPAALAVT
jgi:hypothetical protein